MTSESKVSIPEEPGLWPSSTDVLNPMIRSNNSHLMNLEGSPQALKIDPINGQ